MELNQLFGLPAHPLLVHLPVVLLPLAAVGAVLLVIFPRYLPRLGWVLLVIAGVGTVGAFLAAGSGESLQETLEAGGKQPTATLDRHVELGDQARIVALVFFLVLAAWVVFAWWRRKVGEQQATAKVKNPKAINAVLAGLVVVSSLVSTWWIVQTGHNGAKATWENVGGAPQGGLGAP